MFQYIEKKRTKYYFVIGLTIVFIAFFDLNIFATTYYVSKSGNDLNSGITTTQAWKTLDKVNRAFLKPGDQVLFNRGNVWVGTIKIKSSGKVDNPITFSAYGSGSKPIISGFVTINNWTAEGGGIYSKALPVESNPEIVTINGVQYAMGRTPNADRYNPKFDDYFHIDSYSGNTQITDRESDASSIKWTGAEIVVRTSNYWDWKRFPVTNHIGTTLTFINTAEKSTLGVGFGYFIQNDIRTLDQFGEWYYDGGKFYMYFGVAEPTDNTVKFSTKDRLFDVNVRDFITLKDLCFEGANKSAIATNEASHAYNLTVENCDFDFNYRGIYGHMAHEMTVKNCNFMNSSYMAIYQHWYSDGTYIGCNSIDSTGLIRGVGAGDFYSGTGILVTYSKHTYSQKNTIIEHNTITNSGYMGINFSGDSAIVRYNYIDTYCLIKSDGGGIYQGNQADMSNMTIDQNIVLNGMLNTEVDGLPRGKTSSSQFNIYLDYNSTGGFRVTNNTVAHTEGTGIMIHGSQNVEIKNNTVYNCNVGVKFQELNELGLPTRNVTMDNNVIFSKTTSQLTISARSVTNDFGLYGTFTNNYYVKPNDDTNLFATLVNTWENTYRTFSEWKSFTKLDANSTFVSLKLSKGETERLFYNKTEQTIKFYLGKSVFRDVFGNNISDTFSIEPFTSRILIGKDFDAINQRPKITDQSFNLSSPKAPNDSIGQIFAFEADTAQMLKFSIVKGNEMNLFSIDSLSGRIITVNEINTSRDLIIGLIVCVTDNSVNPLSDSARVTLNIEGKDFSPPTIRSFSIPSSTISYTIPIDTFIASDDIGITGYLLTDNSDPPNPNDTSWSLSSPKFFSSSKEGELTLFAWVKDAAGNISAPALDTILIAQATTQFIDLEKGWNIFSSYLIPSKLNLENVLDSLLVQNKFIEIQDGAGKTFQQNDEGWTNNIGNIRISEGYRIRVNSLCTLEIRGHPVNLPLNIQLHEGLNIISFPYDGSVNAMEVIQPLIDTGIIEKVQDERGKSIEYWGSSIGWINGIGNFKAGEGYIVKINKEGVLPILRNYEKSRLKSSDELEPMHFNTIYEGNGFNHMNVNIIGLKEMNLQVGDEIAAFDGKYCVGAVKISEINLKNNTISIHASASDKDRTNGFNEGNPIVVTVWQANAGIEFQPQLELVKGNITYQNQGSVFVQSLGGGSTETNEHKLMEFNIYPNPAIDKITFKFSKQPDDRTKIIIIDMVGSVVLIKDVKSIIENLDLSRLSSGTYLVKTISKDNYIIKKLIIN